MANKICGTHTGISLLNIQYNELTSAKYLLVTSQQFVEFFLCLYHFITLSRQIGQFVPQIIRFLLFLVHSVTEVHEFLHSLNVAKVTAATNRKEVGKARWFEMAPHSQAYCAERAGRAIRCQLRIRVFMHSELLWARSFDFSRTLLCVSLKVLPGAKLLYRWQL